MRFPGIVFRDPATGAIVPWRVKVRDDVVERPVVPAICTNDEILELHAVLAGPVIGQLAGVMAARPFGQGNSCLYAGRHTRCHARPCGRVRRSV